MALSAKIPSKNTEPVKPPLVVEQEVEYNNDTVSERVDIVNLTEAIVKFTGTASGEQYIFNGAGAVVSVNILDKDELINKKRGKSCCGGQSGTSVFQLA